MSESQRDRVLGWWMSALARFTDLSRTCRHFREMLTAEESRLDRALAEIVDTVTMAPVRSAMAPFQMHEN